MARHLASRGHEVRVLTGGGRYQDQEVRRLPPRERDHGVDVLRTWSPGLGKGRFWKRMVDLGAYLAGVLAGAAGTWSPDVVVAMTSPPFLGLAALAYRVRFRSRVVLWSMDRFPAALAAFGWLDASSSAYRGLECLERTLLANVEQAIALDADMARALGASGARRVRVVPNWERAENFPEDGAAAAAIRARLGLEGRFVVLYSGNLGHDHEYRTLLDAAKRLADRPEVLFLFNGGGALHAGLDAAIRSEGHANVRTHPFVPREDRAALLAAAAVNVVTLRERIVSISTPSKTYGLLASGRPLLYVGPPVSEVARIVDREGCGFAARPGDAAAVERFVRELLADPERGRALGERARRAFLSRYEFRIAMSRMTEILEIRPAAE